MPNTGKIEIKLNKQKLAFMLIGSALFVAGGCWFLFRPPVGNSFRSWEIRIVAPLCIAFFGICFLVILKKIFNTKPGLIIDEAGITDNSSGLSVGFIPWHDIKAIKAVTLHKQKFLQLIVDNPEEYINRQTNSLKRNGMKMSNKLYGSPVSISANSLQCNFDELKNILEGRLAQTEV
jgi:hypothetical protein